MSAANTHNDVLMLSVSGCRGIVGTSLTPETVSRFAGALGTYLVDRHASAKVKGPVVVVVGRDGRAGGAMIADAAIASLNAAGVHVVDTQVAMTPTIGTTVDALGAAGGLVIT
ncbi:MAG: phosphoglucosamine mutase, partial [Planctomyces sp.]